MKYVYYLSVVASIVILALYLFGPYGGIMGIWEIVMKDGLYGDEHIKSIYPVNFADTVLALNKVVAFFFFSSLLTCIVIPFLKVAKVIKYRLVIFCDIILLTIVFFPKISRLLV